MTTAPYIIRTDEHSVGQIELDIHQSRMFTIIDELYEAVGSSTPDKGVMVLIKEAYEYSQRHFEAEENLMRMEKYPGLERQQRAHRGYVWALARLLREDLLTPAALSKDILHFLKEWWLNHILTMDSTYFPFLKEKQLKAAN